MARTPAADPALDGTGLRIAVAVSRYHRGLAALMLEDAEDRARALGAQIVDVADVTGTFDLPVVVQGLLQRADVDAVVALGAIVRGETKHDEVIGHAVAGSLGRLALETGKPVGLGVTGPGQTMAQAEARVDRAGAAVAAVVQSLRTLGARTLRPRLA